MPRWTEAVAIAVVSICPTTVQATGTLLVVDATADPGVTLVVSFAPRKAVAGGVLRIGGSETVRTVAAMPLDDALPVYWMASVLRKGEIVPNIIARRLTAPDENFTLVYSDQIELKYAGGEWSIPSYNPALFEIQVGFGLKSDLVWWAYGVVCEPDRPVRMEPGDYQVVRSEGEDQRGTPVSEGETWPVPIGARSELTFDSSGVGTLRPLP